MHWNVKAQWARVLALGQIADVGLQAKFLPQVSVSPSLKWE